MFSESSRSGFTVFSREPLNAEPSLARLRANYLTPLHDFYVRCHGAVPRLDAASQYLKVGGLVTRELTLRVADLRTQFAVRSVDAVLQCAGNRRADMAKARAVDGDLWTGGAIGHARWTGVSLADVLRAAGIDETADIHKAAETERAADLHVAFDCFDLCEIAGERFHYGASIPLAKALSADVLLAFVMNGEPLAPEHGAPLRAIVPGYAGARSAKWIDRIEVRNAPSDNHIQARDYKLLPPDTDPDAIDWDRGVTINEMPLNALICEPMEGSVLPSGLVSVRGYATASARSVVRVDVSVDGGGTWRQAELEGSGTPWSWTFWSADLELDAGRHEIVVRAWDAAGQTQPASAHDVWNPKGYLCACWHKVNIRVDNA